jgi:hypothetical protein
MRTRIAILAAVILFSVASTQAQPASDPPVRAKEMIPAPISISVSSSVGVNEEVVEWLVKQPDVLLAAARELDPNAKTVNEVGVVQMSVEGHTMPCFAVFNARDVREVDGRTMLSGSLDVHLGPSEELASPQDLEKARSDLRQIAQRLIQALGPRLKNSLSQIENRQFESARARADQAQAQASQLGRKMRTDYLDALAKLTYQGLGLQPEAILVQSIGDLTKQKLELELERAGLQARAQTLEEQTRIAAKRIDEASQADEIVQNYQKVLELQHQRQQNLKVAHQAGQVGQRELSQGEIDLATATVELAKAQRAAAHPRVQELERLSGELANSAVRSAECESKLKYVTEQLEKALANWHNETGIGAKMREELKDLQKRAELFEDENRRKQVEYFLLPYRGDAHVEIFSNPQEK